MVQERNEELERRVELSARVAEAEDLIAQRRVERRKGYLQLFPSLAFIVAAGFLTDRPGFFLGALGLAAFGPLWMVFVTWPELRRLKQEAMTLSALRDAWDPKREGLEKGDTG